jgi:hypothetical protein
VQYGILHGCLPGLQRGNKAVTEDVQNFLWIYALLRDSLNSTCGENKLCVQAEKMMPNGIVKH